MSGFVVSGGYARPETTPGRRLVAFVVRWLTTAFSVWVAAKLVSGMHLEGLGSVLVVALVLGFLNAWLKPLLVIGTLPLLIMSVGFSLILINTVLLALTAWLLGHFDKVNFTIDGFWSAFFGAVIISVVSFLLSRVVNPGRIARGR